MESFASYFWMAVSFINMVLFLIIRHKTKKLYHFFTAMMWFNCALWGMTVSAINVHWIRVLNTTVIPIAAGVFGLVGAIMKLEDSIRNKHI